MDVRLKHNASMTVAGPSMSGKTTFVENLLNNRHLLFDASFRSIHWFTGTQYKPPPSLSFIKVYNEGLPETFDLIKPHDMVILDDLMEEGKTSTQVSSLFTRLVHHLPCFVINITQNLFVSAHTHAESS